MKKITTFLVAAVLALPAYAQNWQEAYERVTQALLGQELAVKESRSVNEYNEARARSAIQYGVALPQELPLYDSSTLLRQYLFNTSDRELIALIDEKGIENPLTIRFKQAVADSNSRRATIVRNQIVEMLAAKFPYSAENQGREAQ